MLEFFSNNFTEFIWLSIILIAIIPTLEGRVAIPFALSFNILGQNTLSPVLALICSFIGTILPCIPILFICIKIKNKTTGFLHDKFMDLSLNKYKDKIKELNSKQNTLRKMLLLGAFVAIPLPLTGVWAGSLIAGFSGLKLWQSFISISTGAFLSCSIILIISLLFGSSVFYFLIASIIIIFIYIIIELILHRKKGD